MCPTVPPAPALPLMLMDKEPDDITPADVEIENTEPTAMKVYAQKDVDREWQFLQDIKAGSQQTWRENQMARFRGDVPEKGMSYTWKRKATQTDSTIIFNKKNADGISRASDESVLFVSLPAFASLNVAWVSGCRDEFGCDGRRRGQGPPAADRDEGHRHRPERRHEPEGAAVRRRARSCAPVRRGLADPRRGCAVPRTEAEEAIIAQAIEMLGCDRSAVVRSHFSSVLPRGLAWLTGRVAVCRRSR